jgi:hypothetical protein
MELANKNQQNSENLIENSKPRYQRICCFTCGPANKQLPFIVCTLFNLGLFAIVSWLWDLYCGVVLSWVLVGQLILIAFQQFLLVYAAWKDPGIINPKTYSESSYNLYTRPEGTAEAEDVIFEKCHIY